MNPITHFLAGWTLLERTQATRRDGALVALVGMAPDLDGLGIVIDFATRTLGLPETDYYQEFHRRYGHGLLSDRLVLAWDGQWPLVGWQNTLITFLLIAAAVALAVRHGYSPVGLFSRKADASVVETLRKRFRRAPPD